MMDLHYSFYQQLFKLVAPRERKRLPGADDARNAMGVHRPQELVRLLTVPFKAHERRRKFSFVPKATPVHTNQPAKTDEAVRSPILSLPVEIKQMIFGWLDDLEDRMSLGLTCTYFWSLALSSMHNKWVSNMGNWAGKNIVFVGMDANAGDYPPGLFSEEEKAALPLQKKHTPTFSSDKRPVSLYELAKSKYSKDQLPYQCDPLHNFLRCLLRGMSRGDLEDFSHPGVVARIADLDDLEEKDFYPTDQPWILRNLTTKEFVRAEAIALKPKFIHGPRIEGLGFGHIVLSRICWSSKPILKINSPMNVARGVWAGHRFDITTVPRHEEATKGEEWVDVSQEVLDEINIIYCRQFGANWRERFMNSPYDGRDTLLEARPGWYNAWDRHTPSDTVRDD
ncbi:hypothetical protein F4805DRAFT_184154 [Annulohypoxylon moriforme]|nr:hypothetical protein F4805DRAFT_184154 [Annulohypoxylon moriforme]